MFARALALFLALACGPVVPVLDAVLFHGAKAGDLAKARVASPDSPRAHVDGCQLSTPRAPLAVTAASAVLVGHGRVESAATGIPRVEIASTSSSTLHSRAPPTIS